MTPPVKVSIILPIYNVEEYLRDCFNSILCQSFKNFEVICVNDGSPDNSQAIVDEFVAKDSRIKSVIQKNGGLSAARNTGIKQATGNWLCFIDPDDKIGWEGRTCGDELQNMVAGIDEETDIVVGNAVFLREDNSVISSKRFSPKKYGSFEPGPDIQNLFPVCAWSKLYRASFLSKFGLQFPEGLKYEDNYFGPCSAAVAKSIKLVDVNFYSYYSRAKSIMAQTKFNKSLKNGEDVILNAVMMIKFFHQYGLLEQNKYFLQKRADALFKSAVQYAPNHDRCYLVWLMGQVIREVNLPTDQSVLLRGCAKGIDVISFRSLKNRQLIKLKYAWYKFFSIFSKKGELRLSKYSQQFKAIRDIESFL